MNEVLFEKSGEVMIVTFNRPNKGNALNSTMANLMKEKLLRIHHEKNIRVVLLRGAGGHFMNGHDYALRTVDITTIQEATYQKMFLLHDVFAA
jgi:enoyl-CoA hydratase/carnithine racemase